MTTLTKADIVAKLIQMIGVAAKLTDEDLKTQDIVVSELGVELCNLSYHLSEATYVPDSPDEEVIREVTEKVALKERDYLNHSTRIHSTVARILSMIAIRGPQVFMEHEFAKLRGAIDVLEEKYKEEKF